MSQITIDYHASPTGRRFHSNDDFVRQLMGPFGSGKSVTCVMELFKRSCEQEPGPGGVRRTRWAIVRNTYRELQDTTIKTFFEWVPIQLGKWMEARQTFLMKFNDIEAEFLFRALDRPQDVKKLLSLEITGAWLNENKEIPKPIYEVIQGRIGRFPAKRDGGPTWSGLLGDTNPPDNDHYLYRIFEDDRPDEHSIYKQPSGLSDGAENVENLPSNYYKRMAIGKDEDWINVYVHGKYGFVKDGKPIYPEYHDTLHTLPAPMPIIRGSTIYVGLDFGRTPAAVFGQERPGDQWYIFDELVTEGMGISRFAKLLAEKIGRDFPDMDIEIYGDPAGEDGQQSDERNLFDILELAGVPAMPAKTQGKGDNDPVIRREAVANNLSRLTIGGVPGLVISPKCKMLRKGMTGGYKYRRLLIAGDERYQEKPDKSIYSHVCEALQYLMIGAGQGYVVTAPKNYRLPKVIRAVSN